MGRNTTWTTVPEELLLLMGGFLHHRDARCMQAVCTSWGHIWTRAGLASPHPAVHQIEICATINCRNRQHLIDAIEPLLAPGTAAATLPFHVLKFLVLLLPVKGIAFIAHSLRLTVFKRKCTHFETSMVFWCNCIHDEVTADPLLVHFTGPEEKQGWVRRRQTPIDQNLNVWVFLIGPTLVLYVACTVIVSATIWPSSPCSYDVGE